MTTTTHLGLPLPSAAGNLEEDVVRIIDAFRLIDEKVAALDTLLSSDDLDLDTVQELVDALKSAQGVIGGILAQVGELLEGKEDADATLTALAQVVTAADKLIYATGPDAFATTTLTAVARQLLAAVSFSAMREALGLTTATQEEMATGTEANVRAMSPSGIAAAIASLSPRTVKKTRSSRTSNAMLVAADLGRLIDITSGSFVQTIDAAANLWDGWYCYLRNSGYQRCTIDPSGSDQINGRLTDRLDPGVTMLLTCDGTGFHSIVIGRRQMRATRNFSILSTAMPAAATNNNAIVALDESRVAYIGCQAASPYNLIACLATVNGPDDVGVQETVSSVATTSNSAAAIRAVKIGTDKLLVVWPTANTINAVVVTFSGGVATFGSKVTQVSSGVADASSLLIADIATDAAIVYSPATSPVLYKVSVTGTVPAFSASLASTTSVSKAFKLDTNRAFFATVGASYVIDGSGAAPVQVATGTTIGRAAYAQTPLSPTSVIGVGTTNTSPRTDVTVYVDSVSGAVVSNTASKSFLAAEFSDSVQAVLYDPVYERALVFYSQNSLVDTSQLRLGWVDIGTDGSKMNSDREFSQLRDVAVGTNFNLQSVTRVIPLRPGRCAMLCKQDAGYPALLILDY